MMKPVLILSCLVFSTCSNSGPSATTLADTSQTQSQTQASTPAVGPSSAETVVPHAGRWNILPSESYIKFSAKQTGDSFTGEFSNFFVDIIFDPDALAQAFVRAEIDMSSFDAGNSDRNGALPGKDWFYIKKFATAVFTSDNFTARGQDAYEARGQLELRGISKPLVLPFVLSIRDDRADMTGKITLNRGDFDVGQGAWATDEWVSLNVDVDVKIAATR